MILLPTKQDRPEAVVLADGDYPAGTVAVSLLANAERVICCDGAAATYVERGGMPAAIVGDCDSLSGELRARYASILHPVAEQESNDLTKAVRFCVGQGLRDITILGATGKREDHTLGNISLLADYLAEGLTVRMVTDYGVFDPICSDTVFESFAGQQVSIFSLNPTASLSGEDLLYPLPQTLGSWWQGTLNESLSDRFTVCTKTPVVVFRVF